MTIPAAMRERLMDLIPAEQRRERPVKRKMAPAPGGGRTGTIYDHTTRDQARTTKKESIERNWQ
jgi:hypothetical protein